jgi:alpha-amylase
MISMPLYTDRGRYWQLLYAFQSSSGSISNLYNMISSVASDCADPTLLGNFIENHDNPRFAS